MRLPTFLVCGAQRSGTTLLWSLLREHPEILIAQPWFPEPKFFSLDSEYKLGLDYYASKYFQHGDSHAAVGEKSVTYLESPQAAQRIHKDLPDVKPIFILRDPVERAFSHYLYSRGNCLEDLSFSEAIIREPYREKLCPHNLKVTRPWAYLSRGLYAEQLSPWLDLFPRSKVKVLIYEQLTTDAASVLSDLFGWLGVSRKITKEMSRPSRVNSRRRPGEAPSEAEAEFLRSFFKEPNRRLHSLLGFDPRW